MGSAAAATCLRRALKYATTKGMTLEGIRIVREELQYRYEVPESWKLETAEGLTSLRGLTRELQPLLVELTGEVVLHRLRDIPQLSCCSLFHSVEQP